MHGAAEGVGTVAWAAWRARRYARRGPVRRGLPVPVHRRASSLRSSRLPNSASHLCRRAQRAGDQQPGQVHAGVHRRVHDGRPGAIRPCPRPLTTRGSRRDAAPEETLTVRAGCEGTIDGDALPAAWPLDLYALDPHGELIDIYETTSRMTTVRVTNVAREKGTSIGATNYADVPQGPRSQPFRATSRPSNRDHPLRAQPRRVIGGGALGADAHQLRTDQRVGLEVWLRWSWRTRR